MTRIEIVRAALALPPEERLTVAREIVLSVGWGSGPSQLGQLTDDEASPEGPMSFLVDDDEQIWVLDQVNQRVQVFKNGSVAATLPLPYDSFTDLAFGWQSTLDLSPEVAHRIVSAGQITVWQYAVGRDAAGGLQMNPLRRVAILKNDTLRIEQATTPFKIIPPKS